MAVRITDKTIRALGIVHDFAEKQESQGRKWPRSGITASVFGEAMWPDSLSAKGYYRGGHGVAMGKGLWLCAGSYLRKLEARGLMSSQMGGYLDESRDYTSHWHLTEEGKAILKEEKAKGKTQEEGKRQAKGRQKTSKAKAQA